MHDVLLLALDLRLGLDVDPPLGQLRSEPYVLAASSDGEGKLIVVDDYLHGLVVVVDYHLAHARWREGVTGEAGRIRRPRHYVYLLALKLLYDILHPGAAHTDARANRVYVRIARRNGYLRTAARVARYGLYHHYLVSDLGDLGFEELLHEVLVTAGQYELRAALGFLDFEEYRPESFLGLVIFPRHLVLGGQYGLGPPEVDYYVPSFDPPHDAAYELAPSVLELLVNYLPLGFFYALEDFLFCILNRYSGEFRIDLDADLVPEFRIRV